MQKENLADFIELSKYAGMREDLVQAGGGNSAYKPVPNRMLIKASGVQLADVEEGFGYAVVNPQIITEAFMQHADADGMTEGEAGRILREAVVEEECLPGVRPSIETFLHAAAGSYSLHTHPITVNVLAARRGGMEELRELFPQALFVPYATPGAALARAYFRHCRKPCKDARVVFLQNHGLLVSADTAKETMELTEDVVRRTADYLGMDMSGYYAVTKLYHAVGQGAGIVWRVTDAHVKKAWDALGHVCGLAFCPDCVVFLGRRVYDAGDRWDAGRYADFRKAYGEPVVIGYRNDLYIRAQSVKKAAEIQSVLSFALQVAQANTGRACSMLTRQEQDFLLGWEAEKYRAAGRTE